MKVKRTVHVVPFASVCDFQNGYAFRNQDYQDNPEGAYKVFRMGNVRKGGGFKEDNSQAYISRASGKSPSRFVLKRGDILMCMTDMKASMALLGHTAMMPFDDEYILNQRVGRITVKDANVVDVRYLYYYTNSPPYIHHLRSMAHSGVQVNLSTEAIKESPIFVPAIDIQRSIACILSAYDDLIENNTRRMKILEQMAKIIYREWFVNFRFPGHENVKMVESEMGPIPEGWEASCIGRLASEMRNSISPTEVAPDTPYVGLEHIPRKSIALLDWGRAGDVQSTKLRFNRGDILFGKIRPYFHKVVVAPIAGVCSSDAIVIVPKKAEFLPLVLCCVSSDDFVAQATQTSQGTKMPRANWDVLTRYPVPVAEASIFSLFNDAIKPMIDLINNLVFRNRILSQTRDLLLPKLISGEIDVKNFDSEAVAQGI